MYGWSSARVLNTPHVAHVPSPILMHTLALTLGAVKHLDPVLKNKVLLNTFTLSPYVLDAFR